MSRITETQRVSAFLWQLAIIWFLIGALPTIILIWIDWKFGLVALFWLSVLTVMASRRLMSLIRKATVEEE